MDNQINELQNAIMAGFTELFVFAEGDLVHVASNVTYAIPCVDKKPFPCQSLNAIVYRINIENLKGYAVVEIPDNDF